MNIIIHDLSEEAWNDIRGDYAGWKVIAASGVARPCIGCFSCWNKDPGCCIIKDGYENMGYLIHHADEVVVLSRYTYGGFSGAVKNIFDRCLGYVLPQFEVINGETHHKKRYAEDKPFTFIFYGHNLSDEEKSTARRYVHAVCANFRAHVKAVIFQQNEVTSPTSVRKPDGNLSSGKITLLNGSMRNIKGNSAKLARSLRGRMSKDSEIVDLKQYLYDLPALVGKLESSEVIILCVPLYVDGLPSQVIRLMESFQRSYSDGTKRIYVLANMGLYESRQLVNLFAAVRQWCSKMGFAYCGGLGVSAGELLGVLIEALPFAFGPAKKVFEGLNLLACAVDSGQAAEEIYAEPYHFPRSLYIHIANTNWSRTAKKNGIRPKDLYRQL